MKMDKLSKQNLQVALDTYRKALPKDLEEDIINIILEEIELSSRFLYDDVLQGDDNRRANIRKHIKKLGGLRFDLSQFDYETNTGLKIYLEGGLENV